MRLKVNIFKILKVTKSKNNSCELKNVSSLSVTAGEDYVPNVQIQSACQSSPKPTKTEGVIQDGNFLSNSLLSDISQVESIEILNNNGERVSVRDTFQDGFCI